MTYRQRWIRYALLGVILPAAVIYLGCIISPPSLMDDVDAVQAQIAHNMLSSGDWVTARLDGVIYLEKSPLIYWIIAIAYKIFGVHDWSARVPVALAAIALAWMTYLFGRWAFGRAAGTYAGICMGTCIGLFLFTRILIPDVMLTFTIALGLYAFMRALEDEEAGRKWALVMGASLGTGLLLKSLIALVFPCGTAFLYLLFTGQLADRLAWKRLHIGLLIAVTFIVAAPWHILATLRNPPYLDFTMYSAPGEYHGFFWFYFINEQLLRFLNLRYPRDYNTVPRLWFWLLHLAWLFPWSVYLPSALRLSYNSRDRASRTRLLAVCWIGMVLVFFSFSTTQEYYSMPCYPAFALLIGSAMIADDKWSDWETRVLSALTAVAAIAAIAILIYVRNIPTPGDIAGALSSHPQAYTLSLGHMEDLTLSSFAYLRLPLAVAAVAFLIGALGTELLRGDRKHVATVAMMVLFFHAARLALVVFDPYMSSRPLADKLNASPDGRLIINHHYYEFSSVFFYTNRRALLLNGRVHNLIYGAYAPGAPPVFIDDKQFVEHWAEPQRWYVIAEVPGLRKIRALVPNDTLNLLIESGGKYLLTNHPLPVH